MRTLQQRCTRASLFPQKRDRSLLGVRSTAFPLQDEVPTGHSQGQLSPQNSAHIAATLSLSMTNGCPAGTGSTAHSQCFDRVRTSISSQAWVRSRLCRVTQVVGSAIVCRGSNSLQRQESILQKLRPVVHLVNISRSVLKRAGTDCLRCHQTNWKFKPTCSFEYRLLPAFQADKSELVSPAGLQANIFTVALRGMNKSPNNRAL